MKKETQQELFNLLYRLEDIYDYNNTELGGKIGTLINKLQTESNKVKGEGVPVIVSAPTVTNVNNSPQSSLILPTGPIAPGNGGATLER